MTGPEGPRPAPPGRHPLRLWPAVTGAVTAAAAVLLLAALVLVFWFFIGTAVVSATPDAVARNQHRLDLWTDVALWSGTVGVLAFAATVVGWAVVRRTGRGPGTPPRG